MPTTTASTVLARARAAAISSSEGLIPTTISSTDANWVRSARARPGSTVDDVSAGVRSTGRGITARIDASLGNTGSPATSVSDRSASSRASSWCSAQPTTSRSGTGPAEASHARRVSIRAAEAATSSGSNSPRAAAASSVTSTRRRDRGYGEQRSTSTPARIAAMTSIACAAPWAIACMSSASLMLTPSNPRSRRNRPFITAGERVAGNPSLPEIAGTATWVDIINLAPAAIAARNGRNDPASSSSREARTTPRPMWLSVTTSPSPGKCFIVAATPADWSPRTIAAPSRATSSGRSPNARMPRLTLSGSVARSRTGA